MGEGREEEGREERRNKRMQEYYNNYQLLFLLCYLSGNVFYNMVSH